VLLVTGGSQGARAVNAAVTGAAQDLAAAGVQVLHVAGPKQADAVRAALGQAPPTHHVLDYVDRMELAYAAADLAVCRAGAMTCAELSAVGLPAVFVPLPIGNGEQALNARPVVDAGGALLVDDAAFDPAYVRDTVLPLVTDGARLRAMSAAAAASGSRDADEALADLVLTAARGRGSR
jgi:UDP-N-acetylglucosamine--N-acetylmuramyl-(pentapeptide) pyrophosphoryl-undecaprenol N-acetylglucosamine transferase